MLHARAPIMRAGCYMVCWLLFERPQTGSWWTGGLPVFRSAHIQVTS